MSGRHSTRFQRDCQRSHARSLLLIYIPLTLSVDVEPNRQEIEIDFYVRGKNANIFLPCHIIIARGDLSSTAAKGATRAGVLSI